MWRRRVDPVDVVAEVRDFLAERARALEAAGVARERIVLDTLPPLSLQIVELARERGRVTIGEVVRLTNANRNTVKKHLSQLVLRRHLAQHGTGKGTWYERA